MSSFFKNTLLSDRRSLAPSESMQKLVDFAL